MSSPAQKRPAFTVPPALPSVTCGASSALPARRRHASSLAQRARLLVRRIRLPSLAPSPGRRLRMQSVGGAAGGGTALPERGVGLDVVPPSPEKVRVLMLISDTGGGHRASAQALKAAFEELYPGAVDARIVDFWTETVGRPFDKLPEGYAVMAKYPQLWRCAWNYGKFPLTRRLTDEVTNIVGNQNFRNALKDFDPDLIVSVHPLTQFIPLRVLKTLPRKIPFVTVCTDLGGAHPTWFHPDADMTFVPTDLVRDIAVKCGIAARQLRQYGLPVRPAFWHEDRAKEDIKADLGLACDVPTVLIVGGGDGIGGVAAITRAIAAAAGNARSRSSGAIADLPALPPAQIVVVCGKNKRLQADLTGATFSVPVHVCGFVKNMSEWMAASDVLVSKAGPGTIAEALIRGLPIVLSGFLPGQEAPNVHYVTDSGVGAFSREPAIIAEIVLKWLDEPDSLAARARRAKDLGRPNATYEIVREMATLTPALSIPISLPVGERVGDAQPGLAAR